MLCASARWSGGWGRDVRSSGSNCRVMGMRRLRRKRPDGGGSVPESTEAATDEASEPLRLFLVPLRRVVTCVAVSRNKVTRGEYPDFYNNTFIITRK